MKTLILAAAALTLPAIASAQTVSNPATVTPFSLTTTSYTQNFNSLASTGSTGTALPAGFQVVENGTNANGSYAVDNGGGNGAGGAYSFGATGSTERALGSIGSGNLAPVIYGGIFTNALNATITDLAFAYTGEQWRVGDSRDDGLSFQYLLGATNVSAGTWTTVSSLAFAPLVTSGASGALNGNLAANQRSLSGTISGLTLAAGQTFGFRWVDSNSTGTDHGLAVDDLSISATLASAGAVPEPASWALMIGGLGMVGGAMRRRSGRVALA